MKQGLFDIPDIKQPKKNNQYVNADMIMRKFKEFDFEFPIELIASSLAGCIESVCINDFSPSKIIKKEIELRKMAKEWYNMPDDSIIVFLYLFKKYKNNFELCKELRNYYKENADDDEIQKYLKEHKKDYIEWRKNKQSE